MDRILVFQQLGIALAVGMLIGAERGWHDRAALEGQRVAGIRTFALAGLLGGLIGLLSGPLTPVFAGIAFASFAALIVASYWLSSIRDPTERGITTEVALLLTLSLGLLSTLGYPLVASATAVIVTILLGLKSVLHAWLERLSADELQAAMKFLLISVVMLPLLPNQGYGPWQALNPHVIWWMVVLVSALSFLGYFAIKLTDSRRGIMLTGLLGGLISSTAVTLSLSRHAAKGLYPPRILAAGVLAGCAIMFPRVLIEASAINPELLTPLLLPLLIMLLSMLGGAWLLWRRHAPDEASEGHRAEQNPFELGPALKFGLLLALIMLFASGAHAHFGDRGLYAVALVSGVVDVDALTLSTARLSLQDLPLETARNAILIAAFTNTLIKIALSMLVGGLALGWRTTSIGLISILLGLAALFI
ncbi:MAG: MgtC/SapB family protein [Pseudomonadota bacterium]